MIGGVAFDSPAGGEPAKAGTRYLLHESKHELDNAAWKYGGLHVVVEAVQLGGLKEGDFVYYKEERVGSVVSTALANDSRHVRVHLNILNEYATLVRTNSVFWNSSGISAKFGLKGLKVHTESLESILAGGIGLATPNSPEARAKKDSVFRLHPEVQDKWLKWSPEIERGGGTQQHATTGSQTKSKDGHHKFFHHEGKTEKEAADDTGHPKDHKKHGFFHWH